MFAAIVTWAGAMLGVTVLLLMAFGSVAIDLDKPRAPRDASASPSRSPDSHRA